MSCVASVTALIDSIDPGRWSRPSATTASHAGLDVLVGAEHVFRVVLVLQLHQLRVVLAVGIAHAAAFVLREEVDVDAAGGERRSGLPQAARPPDAFLVLGRV